MWVGGRIVYVRGRWVVMVEGELVWSVTMRVPQDSQHQPLGPRSCLVGHPSDFCLQRLSEEWG